MRAIRCEGVPGQMHCRLSDIPAFPGESTVLVIQRASETQRAPCGLAG
jgi:hypothetical protein